ncbi:hypothetical protein VP01_919g1 [Puccinia sorghi]|uniref:Uncharacterized protein n=1 Tax=Puccinia sorghi TaxID=27349 RepID=A0A0L6U9G4_9BASI|nr:hypothetical protein VP01_919g1 [Puccinia sorghi]
MTAMPAPNNLFAFLSRPVGLAGFLSYSFLMADRIGHQELTLVVQGRRSLGPTMVATGHHERLGSISLKLKKLSAAQLGLIFSTWALDSCILFGAQIIYTFSRNTPSEKISLQRKSCAPTNTASPTTTQCRNSIWDLFTTLVFLDFEDLNNLLDTHLNKPSIPNEAEILGDQLKMLGCGERFIVSPPNKTWMVISSTPQQQFSVDVFCACMSSSSQSFSISFPADTRIIIKSLRKHHQEPSSRDSKLTSKLNNSIDLELVIKFVLSLIFLVVYSLIFNKYTVLPNAPINLADQYEFLNGKPHKSKGSVPLFPSNPGNICCASQKRAFLILVPEMGVPVSRTEPIWTGNELTDTSAMVPCESIMIKKDMKKSHRSSSVSTVVHTPSSFFLLIGINCFENQSPGMILSTSLSSPIAYILDIFGLKHVTCNPYIHHKNQVELLWN